MAEPNVIAVRIANAARRRARQRIMNALAMLEEDLPDGYTIERLHSDRRTGRLLVQIDLGHLNGQDAHTA